MLKTAASKVAWVSPPQLRASRYGERSSRPARPRQPRRGLCPGPAPLSGPRYPHPPRSPGLGRAKEEAGFLEERLAEAQAERAGYVRLAAQGRISE
jgi:hypothetical protein